MRVAIWLCLACLAWPMAARADYPTVNCKAPAGAGQRMVCRSPALLQLDRALSAALIATEQRFDNGAGAAAAVLADLRARQAAWQAGRDRCTDVACLQAAYASRQAVLDQQGRPGSDAPADRLAGRYRMGQVGTMVVQVRDDDTVHVALRADEPTQGDWVCVVDGVGTLRPDGGIVLHDPGSQAPILTLAHTADGLAVDDTPANKATSDASCGANGSVIGSYARVAGSH